MKKDDKDDLAAEECILDNVPTENVEYKNIFDFIEWDIRGWETTSKRMREWAVQKERAKNPCFTPARCISRAERAETEIIKLKALISNIKDRCFRDEKLARNGRDILDSVPDGYMYSYANCSELLAITDKRITNVEKLIELFVTSNIGITDCTPSIVAKMKQHIMGLEKYVIELEDILVSLTPLL